MTRETTIITITSFLFIAIWIIVIVQIYENRQVEPLITDPIVLEGNYQYEVVDSDDEEEMLEDDETEEVDEGEKVESEKEEEKEEAEDNTIDLRDYDFSDIETPLGIPIDGVLERLGLPIE